MEKSTMPPKAQRLQAEDALASQVLEIIEESDVWSMEEGDDSVFYSDEDQAHQDIKENTTSCDFGDSECEHLVSSEAADEPIPQREDDPGEEYIIENEKSEMEKEVTQQVILTEQEEERQKLQTSETEPTDQSDPAGARSKLSRREFLPLNCTVADMQTQPELNKSARARKVNLPVEEEEVVLDLEPFDVTRLNGEAEVPEQMSTAELKLSGDGQLQVDQEPEQDHNFHGPPGFHQNSGLGYSTLPLPNKSSHSDDHQKSYNHLTSSKYSTVSYRKIRRGNTRQKIEEFEYMIMNL